MKTDCETNSPSRERNRSLESDSKTLGNAKSQDVEGLFVIVRKDV
jgi:hypothetical protein